MKKFLSVIFLFSLLGQALAATTFKGYLSSGKFGWHAVNNNYAGSNLRYEDTWTMDTGNAFGVGLEQPVLRLKQQELLLGVYYLFPQELQNPQIKGKLSGIMSGQASVRGNFLNTNTIQVSSVYLKPRLFFHGLPEYGSANYIAAKLSYNTITLTGDLAEELPHFDKNAVGYGLAIGSIYDNVWEWEIAYDNVINPRIETPAAFLEDDDTLTGTYYFGQVLVSVGYRL